MGTSTSIIPVPTYLLDDDQLIDLNNRLKSMDDDRALEGDPPCPRSSACCAAITAELKWRNGNFRLNPDGTISRD